MDTDGMQFENPIDNLTYLYDDTNKNQLLRVFDSTANPQGFSDDSDGISDTEDDYAYDDNGNMTHDDNKGITHITYNHLNLPVEIIFGTYGKIAYLYNATGQKLKKTVTEGTTITTTDYLSGFQYKNLVLQFFPHAEGYVNATEEMVFMGGTSYRFNYVFNYTDHLGNIRLSYSLDPSTKVLKIIEENHYYPFGLKHSGYNSDKMMYTKEAEVLKIKPVPPLFITSYKYKYNGKEYQDELGLNMYDYQARNYDPALGRFSVPDPMQELYYGINSYAYVFNNPVQLVDPTGMIVEYADDPNKTKKENRQARREFKKSQRELNRNSPEAKKNWKALKSSKNVHTIHLNEKDSKGDFIKNHVRAKSGYKSGEGNGGGSDIYINLNTTVVQGEELGTNIIGIGHEEGHAYRIDQGMVEGDYINDSTNPDDFNLMLLHISKILEKEEIEATHIENIIRAQLDPTGQKYPLRSTYDNKELYRRNPFNNKVEPYKKDLKTIKDGYDYYKKDK